MRNKAIRFIKVPTSFTSSRSTDLIFYILTLPQNALKKGQGIFMEWELLNVVGTIAFAASGAIIAMDEKYDIFGVWLLAFTTAFGGGANRNV
jgi:hypothetical protein